MRIRIFLQSNHSFDVMLGKYPRIIVACASHDCIMPKGHYWAALHKTASFIHLGDKLGALLVWASWKYSRVLLLGIFVTLILSFGNIYIFQIENLYCMIVFGHSFFSFGLA